MRIRSTICIEYEYSIILNKNTQMKKVDENRGWTDENMREK